MVHFRGALVYKGGVSGCRGLTALLSFKFPPFSRFLTLRQLTAQQLARQVSSVNKLAYKRCFKTQRHLSRDSKEVFHEIILIPCNNVLSHTIHELVGYTVSKLVAIKVCMFTLHHDHGHSGCSHPLGKPTCMILGLNPNEFENLNPQRTEIYHTTYFAQNVHMSSEHEDRK